MCWQLAKAQQGAGKDSAGGCSRAAGGQDNSQCHIWQAASPGVQRTACTASLPAGSGEDALVAVSMRPALILNVITCNVMPAGWRRCSEEHFSD